MTKILFTLCLSVVLLLVSFSSLAFAECAWVLWTKKEWLKFPNDKLPQTEIYWDLVSATPKYDQCIEMQAQVWKNMEMFYKKDAQSHMKIVSKPGLIIIRYGDSGGKPDASLTESYHCFPDTIDPRKK